MAWPAQFALPTADAAAGPPGNERAATLQHQHRVGLIAWWLNSPLIALLAAMEADGLFYLLADQRQAALFAREARKAAAAQAPTQADAGSAEQHPDEGGAPAAAAADGAAAASPSGPAAMTLAHQLVALSHHCAATSVLYALASDAEDTTQYSAAACSEALLTVLLPQPSPADSACSDTATAARTAAAQAATAAHSASQLARRLLELGADPNHAREEDGLSPLLAAVQGGHAEVAGLLLEAGALPDGPPAQPAQPATPAAAAAGGPGAAEAAAAAEPSAVVRPTKRKRQGEGGQQDGGQVAARPMQPTPLVQALAARNAVLVERLLAAGADANLPCSAQSSRDTTVQLTPLIAAVTAGDAALVARLLVAGADLHKKCATANGSDWTR